ncbi:AIPR protein [Caulifigura coniformis]|uniref:AIPR protein n=1 Tax=Caulifigura coniformis TaxID=2527983 RepID=A0A517SM73_9PLAN|nr:AIPR family protein [Caulifigura coniformis]QDT57219.1 AIPR protein [Caulifigura coniformis]
MSPGASHLDTVRVPAKIIVLRSVDEPTAETLISEISQFANSQNPVKQSDLAANRPLQVEIEKLSMTTFCPDGVGRWYYERAAGSYHTMLAREGNTPATLRRLRTVVVPPSRKVTKTDLAKAIQAWSGKPDVVSLGGQKNFDRFMAEVNDGQDACLPSAADYKAMIAKVILLKRTTALLRPLIKDSHSFVATYLVSLMGTHLATGLALDRVWQQQDISSALRDQILAWGPEVNLVMRNSVNGRQMSEWAKRPECWTIVKSELYSPCRNGIPELK